MEPITQEVFVAICISASIVLVCVGWGLYKWVLSKGGGK